MSRERWGTFSVIDHKNAATLVPEVLLYDRLVLPVPTTEDDRKRWTDRGWAPDVLNRRLEQLGPLAIAASWGYAERKRAIEAWEQHMKTVRSDAEQIVRDIKAKAPYQMTRMVLANDKPVVLPPGVTDVVSVAAFQSEEDFNTCYRLQSLDEKSSAQPPKKRRSAPSPDERRAALGFLLGQKLAVPDEANPELALRKAIELANDDSFREKRRKLYEWQEAIVRDQIKPEVALKEMNQMVAGYNRAVQKATRKVYFRFAFTIASVALGLAASPVSPLLASATVFLALAQFTTLDRKPVIEAGESAPAAMFHDIRKIALWR
jgi:hypothetical protein